MTLTDTVEASSNVLYSTGMGTVQDAKLKVSLEVPKATFKKSSVTVETSGKW